MCIYTNNIYIYVVGDSPIIRIMDLPKCNIAIINAMYEMDIACSYIYIYIELRNLETRKILTTSLFRYETFYYFWV